MEGTAAQKENFYTSLYHLFIQPNNIADQIRELQKEPVKNGKKISKLASTMYSIDLIRELNRKFNDLKQQLDAAKLPNDIPDIIPELPKDGGDAKPRSN